MKTLLMIPVLVAAGALGLMSGTKTPPPFAAPEMVQIAAGTVPYRPLGNFSARGKAQTPQPVTVAVAEFEIMKYQVSRAQYAACVADGGCERVTIPDGPLPQTMISWHDATAFAAWYSRRTGETWRLPREPEWQLAAAERYGDAAPAAEPLDPGQRMLANYERGILLRGTANPALRPTGAFGVNSAGVADISGNVWEWTDSCMQNGTINPDGSLHDTDPYCGVRIAGGVHRAAIIDFVRDASVGGCAVGLPPDHLGFRLVRDR